MLPRSHRLTSDRDYRRAYRKGARFFSKHVLIRMTENSLPTTRFGIVVSQKIEKKANRRNKIKRRISEILRLRLAKVRNGYDFVIIVKKSIIDANFSETASDLDYLLKKSGLI